MGSSSADNGFTKVMGSTLKLILRRPILLFGLLIAIALLIGLLMSNQAINKPRKQTAAHQSTSVTTTNTPSSNQQPQSTASNSTTDTTKSSVDSQSSNTNVSTTTTDNSTSSSGGASNQSHTTVTVNGHTVTAPANGCVTNGSTRTCSENFSDNDNSQSSVVSNTSTNISN